MDFEIEDDPAEVDYDFDWNDSKPKNKSQKSYFGSAETEQDEYMYDFTVDKKKNKATPQLSAFSPMPTSHKGMSNTNNNNVTVVNNESALEKAQNMLNRYSNKTFNEPVSNFRQPPNVKKFSEDDISVDSEVEFSDMEVSDSEDFGAKKGGKNLKTQTGKTLTTKTKTLVRDINELGSQAVVTVGEEDDDISDDEDGGMRDFLNRSNLSDSAQKGDFDGDDSEHDDYSDEDFDEDEDRPNKPNNSLPTASTIGANKSHTTTTATNNVAVVGGVKNMIMFDGNEYSMSYDDQFDIHDKSAAPIGRTNNLSHHSIHEEIHSEDDEENQSYSRMVYGDQDDEDEISDEQQDEDEIAEELESSKPILMSFADLAAIPQWDANSSKQDTSTSNNQRSKDTRHTTDSPAESVHSYASNNDQQLQQQQRNRVQSEVSYNSYAEDVDEVEEGSGDDNISYHTREEVWEDEIESAEVMERKQLERNKQLALEAIERANAASVTTKNSLVRQNVPVELKDKENMHSNIRGGGASDAAKASKSSDNQPGLSRSNATADLSKTAPTLQHADESKQYAQQNQLLAPTVTSSTMFLPAATQQSQVVSQQTGYPHLQQPQQQQPLQQFNAPSSQPPIPLQQNYMQTSYPGGPQSVQPQQQPLPQQQLQQQPLQQPFNGYVQQQQSFPQSDPQQSGQYPQYPPQQPFPPAQFSNTNQMYQQPYNYYPTPHNMLNSPAGSFAPQMFSPYASFAGNPFPSQQNGSLDPRLSMQFGGMNSLLQQQLQLQQQQQALNSLYLSSQNPLAASMNNPLLNSLQGPLVGNSLQGSLLMSNNSNVGNTVQPLMLDLLQELRKTKEEAEWAKNKLAETILMIRDQDRQRSSIDSLPTTTSNIRNNTNDSSSNSNSNTKSTLQSIVTETIQNAMQNGPKASKSPVIPGGGGNTNAFGSSSTVHPTTNTSEPALNKQQDKQEEKVLISAIKAIGTTASTQGRYGNNNNNHMNRLSTDSSFEESEIIDETENSSVNSDDDSNQQQDEDEDDYSNDFEESHLNISTVSSVAAPTATVNNNNKPNSKSPRKNVTMADEVKGGGGGSTNNNSISVAAEQQSAEQWANDYIRNMPKLPTYTSQFNSTDFASNKDSYTSAMHASINNREKVLEPLRESLAHSLLSSQELFRSQLDSLRLRLSMTNSLGSNGGGVLLRPNMSSNDMHTAFSEKLNKIRDPDYIRGEQALSQDTSSLTSSALHSSIAAYQSAPSLTQLKSQFESKRLQDTKRLYELLTRKYPGLEDEEAVTLAEKY